MANLLKKIVGTSSQRKLKEIEPIVKKIEALEEIGIPKIRQKEQAAFE